MANITKSASKTLTAPASSSAKYKLTAKFEETSVDTTNNKSTIKVTATLASDSGYSFSGSTEHTLKIYWYDNNDNDGGKSVKTTTVTSMSAGGSSTATGSITVPHRADGSLKGYAKAVWSKSGSNSYVPPSGNVSTAETAVTSIARTPVFTANPTITNTTETSITIDRGATNISSNFTYSISPNAGTLSTSGSTATYSGLSANTAYTITVTAANSANTSLTATKQVSTTTWAYPSISSIGSTTLTPGNSQTIYLNNPHSRSVTWYMRMNSTSSSTGTQVTTGTSTGTSVTFTPNIDTLFNSNGLGTSKTSINAFYYITYSGQTSSKTGTIAITESAYKPTWGSITANQAIKYKDIDSTTVGITGSDQILVTGKSKFQYTKDSNYNATAVRSTISKYQISTNGSTYTDVTAGTYIPSGGTTVPTSASSVKIYLRAVDNRGYKSDPLVKTISGSNLKVYANPTGIITAQRENNYSETTIFLNIKPTWSVNSTNNKGTATYEYQEGSGSFSTAVTTSTFNSNIAITGSFSNSKTYTFRVRLKDNFNGTSEYLYATVGPGVPIFMIDSATNSVGCQCFPRSGSALEVAGPAYFTDTVQFNGAIQNNHYAVVGQSSNTAGANTWYKFASVDINTTYTDRNIWFKVYSGYGDNSTAIGELMAHVRTGSDRSFQSGELQWITCGEGIDINQFVMAYYNDTSGSSVVLKVELWVSVTQNWRRYKFIPQAEGDTSQEQAGKWTLYKTKTESGEASPTGGYTLITSTIATLKNSTSGNAASAYKLTAPDGNRPTSADLAHEYTDNRATKRIDLVTGYMTTNKPNNDGWIETYFWDKSNAYDAQFFIPNVSSKHLQVRMRSNASSWPSEWKDLAYYEDIPTLPTETAWTAVTLKSGISAGSYGTPQYKKIGNQVFLRGSYQGTKVSGTTLILGTLPSGFRPSTNIYTFCCLSWQRVGRIYVSSSGDIGFEWAYTLSSNTEWAGDFSWLSFQLSFWID